jgi:hypothetical protein
VSAMQQHTLDEAMERHRHIARLTRSMDTWRARGLDVLLAGDYQYYCELLAYLCAGGAYTVRTFDPMAALDVPAKQRTGPVAEMVADIARGFAQVSRTYRHQSRKEMP